MSNHEPTGHPHQPPPRPKPQRSRAAKIAIGCAIVMAILVGTIVLLIGACAVAVQLKLL
jgi:hypothetical protein